MDSEALLQEGAVQRLGQTEVYYTHSPQRQGYMGKLPSCQEEECIQDLIKVSVGKIRQHKDNGSGVV